MIRRLFGLLLAIFLLSLSVSTVEAQAPYRAYGRVWGGAYGNTNWERFYHYPYVYYPQNFWGNEYYRSGPNLYHRYPPEMRIPVYNKQWHNSYPNSRRYHYGHHFLLDVF